MTSIRSRMWMRWAPSTKGAKMMARDAPTRGRRAGSRAGNELEGTGQKGSAVSPTTCCCAPLKLQNCSWLSKVARPIRVRSESACIQICQEGRCTMRIGSTAKVPAKRKLKYCTIAE